MKIKGKGDGWLVARRCHLDNHTEAYDEAKFPSHSLSRLLKQFNVNQFCDEGGGTLMIYFEDTKTYTHSIKSHFFTETLRFIHRRIIYILK